MSEVTSYNGYDFDLPTVLKESQCYRQLLDRVQNSWCYFLKHDESLKEAEFEGWYRQRANGSDEVFIKFFYWQNGALRVKKYPYSVLKNQATVAAYVLAGVVIQEADPWV